MTLLERIWNQWMRPLLWLLLIWVSVQLIVSVLQHKGPALSMFLATVMPFYALGKFYFFFNENRKEEMKVALGYFHWMSMLIFIPGFWLVLFKAQMPFAVVLVSLLFMDELLNNSLNEKS